MNQKIIIVNKLKEMLDAALKYFDNESPYVYYPSYNATNYSDKVQGIESFARILWGACFADETVLNKNSKIRLMKAIVNGTNKSSSEYWGDLTDYSQLAVEMVPIAFFVFLNKDIFLSLNIEDQNNIANWLYQINNVKLYNNNWQCFIVLVNSFLQLLDYNYSPDNIKDALYEIDKMYIEDGWYSDGKTDQIDYYVSFAIHYYLLIYVYYSPSNEDNKKYLDRSLLFSKTFLYWFADNGAALPFGRSLTYKFAQSAFWSSLAMNDVPADVKSLAKGIIYRNLDWWSKKDIFDKNGLLTLGFAYPNQQMLEFYNSSGSPYWALKTFIFLLIPDDNVFWNEPFKNLPELQSQIMISPARMVIGRYNGNPYAFVNGQKASYYFGHTESKYEKFVYNSEVGFCISKSNKSLEFLAPDSTIAISFNGHEYLTRNNYQVIKTEENRLVSQWKPISNITITTIVIPKAPAHIRVHYIDTNEKITLIDGGFSMPNDNMNVSSTNGYLYASNKDILYACGSISGCGDSLIINATPNSSIMFKRCSIPAVRYNLTPGKYKVIDWFYMGDNSNESIKRYQDFDIENNTIRFMNDIVDISIDDLNKFNTPNHRFSGIKNTIKRIFRI